MSLINEALKKAQRHRTEEPAADTAAAPAGGAAIAKRSQPKSANATVMIAIGALVLVAISIAITAWWLTRPVGAAAVPAAKPAPAAAVAVAPTPKLVLPDVATLPNPTGAVKTTREPANASTAAPATSTSPLVDAGSGAPAAATVAPAPQRAVAAVPPPPKPKPQPDERVRHFIDSLRVAGVNASGATSKVLMNDHVYRLNQLVDPDLGVRLTKVSSDSLTFTDRNGVTYVKYF